MAGIGAEGAYGAAATQAGIRQWLNDRRMAVEQQQADEDRLRNQRVQDEEMAAAKAELARRIDRQGMLDQRESLLFEQGQQDRQAEMAANAQTAEGRAQLLTQIDQMDLPPMAKLGAKITVQKGGALPASFFELGKAPERKLQFAPNGQLVDVNDPTNAGKTFAAPKAGPSEASILANTMLRLKIDEAQQKQADAATAKVKEADAGRQQAADAVATIDRLLAHPGLAASTGAYELRGFTPAARDFRAELDRFVAQQTKGNLGTLKGPMSDKDIAFIKAMSTTAGNTNISDEALIAELKRARAAYTGGEGDGQMAALTRTQRNRRTGETRTQTSTDGGKTWQ